MMNKRIGMFGAFVLLVLVLGSEVRAQPSSKQAGVSEVVYGSVDGRVGAVLRTGGYALIAQVGHPFSGGLAGGGLWWLGGRRPGSSSSLGEASEVPRAYGLSSNYPNPFRWETTIEVFLPEASRVELVVYDVLGREVSRLVDAELGSGRHAVVFGSEGLSSGVYVYRLVAGAFTKHRTMLLLK